MPTAICSLPQLTAIDVQAERALPVGVVAGITAQLTRLQRLRLGRLSPQAWSELPHLSALRQLSSLGLTLDGYSNEARLGLSALLPSGGGSVRRLELNRHSGPADELPLGPLAGLEALAVQYPLQASRPRLVSRSARADQVLAGCRTA